MNSINIASGCIDSFRSRMQLDAGCWILDAGYWILDTYCSEAEIPFLSGDIGT